MSTPRPIAPASRPPSGPIGLIADLGGMAILAGQAVGSAIRRGEGSASIVRVAFGQIAWMLRMGLPLVGLIHVSFGSFLTMQAYFGATFTEAAGIVVGLGLIRNVTPLLVGFVMAGLIGVQVTSDLRGGPRPGLDDPTSLPDRDVGRGLRPDDRPVPGRGRLAIPRLLAAVLAGPVLTVWGVGVGILMGALVARSMLGQDPEAFLGKIAENLAPADVLGLAIKGVLFPGAAMLIATFEGLRPESRGGPSAYRAVLRSVVAILVLNFTWFNLVYLAGDPFGPEVARSPG